MKEQLCPAPLGGSGLPGGLKASSCGLEPDLLSQDVRWKGALGSLCSVLQPPWLSRSPQGGSQEAGTLLSAPCSSREGLWMSLALP